MRTMYKGMSVIQVGENNVKIMGEEGWSLRPPEKTIINPISFPTIQEVSQTVEEPLIDENDLGEEKSDEPIDEFINELIDENDVEE